MNEPSDHGIATATAALAKANLFDQTISRPDPSMVAAWAQMLDDIDPDEAVYAVDRFYATVAGRRVMPADIINLVRERRRDAALRGVIRRREIEAPRDPEASRRGYLAAKQAVTAALSDAGVAVEGYDLSVKCGWCGARPGERCMTNGAVRETPHPSRLEQVSA